MPPTLHLPIMGRSMDVRYDRAISKGIVLDRQTFL